MHVILCATQQTWWSSFYSPTLAETLQFSDIESITQPLLLCDPLLGAWGEKRPNYNSFAWNIIWSPAAATYCCKWPKILNNYFFVTKLQTDSMTFNDFKHYWIAFQSTVLMMKCKNFEKTWPLTDSQFRAFMKFTSLLLKFYTIS